MVDLRAAVEASMNDLALGTPERVERARQRLAAVLATPEADLRGVGLDAAWQRAEAALPEGWAITMLWGTITSERWGASAAPWPTEPNMQHEFGGGATPADALNQLAERLSERDKATGDLTLDQLRARSEKLEQRTTPEPEA